MLWAIVSSAFVIYLYRTLNAGPTTGTTGAAVPADAMDAQLARLNSRIAAIEGIISGQARGIKP